MTFVLLDHTGEIEQTNSPVDRRMPLISCSIDRLGIASIQSDQIDFLCHLVGPSDTVDLSTPFISLLHWFNPTKRRRIERKKHFDRQMISNDPLRIHRCRIDRSIDRAVDSSSSSCCSLAMPMSINTSDLSRRIIVSLLVSSLRLKKEIPANNQRWMTNEHVVSRSKSPSINKRFHRKWFGSNETLRMRGRALTSENEIIDHLSWWGRKHLTNR